MSVICKMGRIYVADDDWPTKDRIVTYLMDAGWEVVGSSCKLRNAIQSVLASEVDVLILDIRFDGEQLDGIQAAEQILRHKKLDVIFLTALTDQHTKERAEAVGAVGFIEKATDYSEELANAIKFAFERREFEKRNAERIALIKLETDRPLSEWETTRLEELESLVERYLDQHYPLQTDSLSEFYRQMKKA